MARTTLAVAKFVGSISLGLLTGISYTLSTITIPSLLTLPAATTAHQTFVRLQTVALAHLRALSVLSTSSFLVAYCLSPRRGRHPYLLWTALTVALSAGTDLYLGKEARKMVRDGDRRRAGDESPANGEEVKNGMEQFQIAQAVRASVAGLGFLMSVVGIWGDAF
ncbi:MAG: hypothetical protein M1826_003949 [Phylliscum demangeonii]|nr:MAG: hypothetical protein M1826_003949 [Phylliscum demangeonii]